MNTKPEYLVSEINHMLQVLVIDFDLFARTNEIADKKLLTVISIQFSELKKLMRSVKKYADLTDPILEESKKITSNMIEQILDLKMNSRESKNEKIAILNQVHQLKNLLSAKK